MLRVALQGKRWFDLMVAVGADARPAGAADRVFSTRALLRVMRT